MMLLRSATLLTRAYPTLSAGTTARAASIRSFASKDDSERPSAAQLYEEIFKNPSSSSSSSSPPPSSSSSSTPNPASPDAPAAAKPSLWQQLFANRVLSQGVSANEAQQRQQQEEEGEEHGSSSDGEADDKALLSDPENLRLFRENARIMTSKQAFNSICTEGALSFLLQRDIDGDSLANVRQTWEEVHLRGMSPESVSLFDRYPRKVKIWLRNAFRPRGKFNAQGQWEAASGAPSGLYVAAVNRTALAENRPQDCITVRDVLPIVPTGDLMASQGIIGAEEFGGGAKAVYTPPKRRERLPDDLVGKYMFGIQPDEVESLSPKLKDVLSFHYATQPDINRHRIAQAVEKWRRDEYDTGSPEVQIAVLSERIRYMSEHFKTHRKDKHSMRGLERMVNTRRSMLKYLKQRDIAKYYQLLKHYQLREV